MLIPRGTHVFFGGRGLLRPEGSKFEANVDSARGVLGEGTANPSPPVKGSGECCKLPQWGSGQSTNRKYILDLLKSQKTHWRSRGTLGHHWQNPRNPG